MGAADILKWRLFILKVGFDDSFLAEGSIGGASSFVGESESEGSGESEPRFTGPMVLISNTLLEWIIT